MDDIIGMFDDLRGLTRADQARYLTAMLTSVSVGRQQVARACLIVMLDEEIAVTREYSPALADRLARDAAIEDEHSHGGVGSLDSGCST